MNSQLLKVKVLEKRKEIEIAMQELANLRAECTHIDYDYKYHSNTGNYDPSLDNYWTEYECNICLWQWQEDGSHKRHKYLESE